MVALWHPATSPSAPPAWQCPAVTTVASPSLSAAGMPLVPALPVIAARPPCWWALCRAATPPCLHPTCCAVPHRPCHRWIPSQSTTPYATSAGARSRQTGMSVIGVGTLSVPASRPDAGRRVWLQRHGGACRHQHRRGWQHGVQTRGCFCVLAHGQRVAGGYAAAGLWAVWMRPAAPPAAAWTSLTQSPPRWWRSLPCCRGTALCGKPGSVVGSVL